MTRVRQDIQFQPHDSEPVRLEKLRRLAFELQQSRTVEVNVEAGAGIAITTADSVFTIALASITGPALMGIIAGSAAPGALTPAQATALLDVFTQIAKGLVPAPGAGTLTRVLSVGGWVEPGSTSFGSGYPAQLGYAGI